LAGNRFGIGWFPVPFEGNSELASGDGFEAFRLKVVRLLALQMLYLRWAYIMQTGEKGLFAQNEGTTCLNFGHRRALSGTAASKQKGAL
jgi:hypothetical protein